MSDQQPTNPPCGRRIGWRTTLGHHYAYRDGEYRCIRCGHELGTPDPLHDEDLPQLDQAPEWTADAEWHDGQYWPDEPLS